MHQPPGPEYYRKFHAALDALLVLSLNGGGMESEIRIGPRPYINRLEENRRAAENRLIALKNKRSYANRNSRA